jgi:hypothetical protein
MEVPLNQLYQRTITSYLYRHTKPYRPIYDYIPNVASILLSDFYGQLLWNFPAEDTTFSPTETQTISPVRQRESVYDNSKLIISEFSIMNWRTV